MKIVIVGASGFVGTSLRDFFEMSGHTVVGVKIRKDTSINSLTEELEDCDVLINLAGLSIFGRWDGTYKEMLYTSRIDTTRKLIEAMKACENRPRRFISTSAVGIYVNDVVSDEESSELSKSFLATICKDWEKEALKAQSLGVSTLLFRSGVVLGKEGGMLQKLWLPFKLGLGGRVGDGEQPLSWIHIEDLCSAYKMAVEGEMSFEGPVNLCAPEFTTNKELTEVLGGLMKRPTLLTLPAWLIRLIFAEGSAFILEGQKAYPKRLLETGFKFKYSDIHSALKSFF